MLALHGELGAGKTHLVRGIAAGLGVSPEQVSSPTFTLLHEYEADAPLYHIDAYRLERSEEWGRLGFDEYLTQESIVVVEWPERVAEWLPGHTLHLYIEHGGGDTRRFRWR